VRKLWQRFTRKHAKITRQNEIETYDAFVRDRQQRDDLIHSQQAERQTLQKGISHTREQQEKEIQEVKHKLFSSLSKDKTLSLQAALDLAHPQQDQNKERNTGPSLSI